MKLRLMKKLWKKCDVDLDSVRDQSKRRMLDRYEKLATTKATNTSFRNLMQEIGPGGRAWLIRFHDAGAAFDMLMKETK